MMETWIASALLASALAMFAVRKIAGCIAVLSFQSALLSAVALKMWKATGDDHLLWLSLLTLAVKTVAIPLLFLRTIRAVGADPDAKSRLSRPVSAALALLIATAGHVAAGAFHLPAAGGGGGYLPVAVALVLLGMFLIIDQTKMIMQGIGLVVTENGLFLIAGSIGGGMPLIVELAALFDLTVSVALIGSLALRIYEVFESLDTDKMNRLRG